MERLPETPRHVALAHLSQERGRSSEHPLDPSLISKWCADLGFQARLSYFNDEQQPIYSQQRIFLDIRDKYFARSGGILSQKLTEKCVSVFGCGSGGSYLAEQLVRSGVGKLILCDYDTVEAENLCRSGYEIGDLGTPKVNALARKLRNINPTINLKLYNQDLISLPHEELSEIFMSSQAIVAGTDMPRAQEILNKYSYQIGVPAVFPGLYERALGGQIVMTIPGITPCYICSLGLRRALSEPYITESDVDQIFSHSTIDKSEVDYSTGTLKAEQGKRI